MSVSKAKEHCGYQSKPVHSICSNCRAFASDLEYPTWVSTPDQRSYFDRHNYAKVEKNLRCIDHGFATKKTATCRLWHAKDAPEGKVST